MAGFKNTGCDTLKAHRTTALTSPVVATWTDFDGLTQIDEESCVGSAILEADGKTITALQSGMFNFGGCVHFQNNSGVTQSPFVASRIFQNGTTEARCSQRAWEGDSKVGGENVLSYNGTIYLTKGDTITLQYYVGDNSIEFNSNAIFDNQVACTIWVTFAGNK